MFKLKAMFVAALGNLQGLPTPACLRPPFHGIWVGGSERPIILLSITIRL